MEKYSSTVSPLSACSSVGASSGVSAASSSSFFAFLLLLALLLALLASLYSLTDKMRSSSLELSLLSRELFGVYFPSFTNWSNNLYFFYSKATAVGSGALVVVTVSSSVGVSFGIEVVFIPYSTKAS